jgi:hypothetical protein
MAVNIPEICCDSKVDQNLLALLGIVSLNFNYSANLISLFVCEYLGLDLPVADRLTLNMNEATVIDLCRTIIPDKEKDAEVCQACEAFLDIFNILSENRNIVMHSLASSNGPQSVTLLRITKRGHLDRIEMLQDELAEVCRESRALFLFGYSIIERLRDRKTRGLLQRHRELLPTPPKPRKLHLRQITQNSDQAPLES